MSTTELYTLSLHDALPICLKKLLGADDALDVFGVHAVGGILGALLTGVFNAPQLGGPSFPVDWFTGKITPAADYVERSEEHTSELQSLRHLVCRLLLEKKK